MFVLKLFDIPGAVPGAVSGASGDPLILSQKDLLLSWLQKLSGTSPTASLALLPGEGLHSGGASVTGAGAGVGISLN